MADRDKGYRQPMEAMDARSTWSQGFRWIIQMPGYKLRH